jgi:periplasmic divalent cation tolerance protein
MIGEESFVQVSTAAPSREVADAIALALLERRLAACVQVVGPVRSTYRWQGSIESAEEWLCLIKTTRARYDALERAIRELHPYETPEVIALPIVAGDAAYLRWISDQIDAKP